MRLLLLPSTRACLQHLARLVALHALLRKRLFPLQYAAQALTTVTLSPADIVARLIGLLAAYIQKEQHQHAVTGRAGIIEASVKLRLMAPQSQLGACSLHGKVARAESSN